jgi:hypothetical protein
MIYIKSVNYGQELTFWVEQTSAVILLVHFSWVAEGGVRTETGDETCVPCTLCYP